MVSEADSMDFCHSGGLEALIILKQQHEKYLESSATFLLHDRVVKHLEKSNGLFVCGECFNHSTWEPDNLLLHYNSEHDEDLQGICPYCFSEVPLSKLCHHQLSHFSLDPTNVNNLYVCHLCNEDDGSARFADKSSYMEHYQAFHSTVGEDFSCTICDHKFSTASQLANHMEDHIRPLYRCTVEGCFIASSHKSTLQRHLNRRHQSTADADSTPFVACAVRLPPLPQSADLTIQQSVTSADGNTTNMQQNNGLCGSESGLVYCLKCPYCSFVTVLWSKFAQHQTKCSLCPATSFTFNLRSCSDCGAVSTEPGLIQEHIVCSRQRQHNSQAVLLEEEVAVTLISASTTGKPDSTFLSAASYSANSIVSALKRPLSDHQASGDVDLGASHHKLSRLEQELSGPSSPSDILSFPFDEDSFRATFSPGVETDAVVEKMHSFTRYRVRILRKENHRRIPECPECKKAFTYGLGDFKRHLMTVHLEIPREYIKDCLRCSHLPKAEAPFQELQEQLTMKNFKPVLIEMGRRRIPLPFSTAVLRKLTGHFSKESQDYLIQKMKTYSTLHVVMDTRNGKKYQCGSCNYLSPHALADVRKHILGSHCGISTKHFRYCLQASRLDPVEFTLLPDDKLFRLAKDFVRRVRKPNSSQQQQSNEIPLQGDQMQLALSGASSTSLPPDNHLSNESVAPASNGTDVGSMSAMASLLSKTLSGDKGGSSLIHSMLSGMTFNQLSPAVLMNGSDHHNLASSSVAAEVSGPASAASDSDGSKSKSSNYNVSESPRATSGSGNQGQNSSHFEEADDVDEEEVISLPFSEAVLRQLTSDILDNGHQDMLLAKMHTYSSFQLVRQLCKGKTVAYRCACGRVFHTVRRPDKSVRPSTLADARRHVMGVHARINHELLTICCQASRISRENSWRIYSDDMLLRLASERPPKAVVQKSFEDSVGNGLTSGGVGVSLVSSMPADNMSDNADSEGEADTSSCSQQPSSSIDQGNMSVFPSMIYDPPVWPTAKAEPRSPSNQESDSNGFFANTFSSRNEPPIQQHEMTTPEQRISTLSNIADHRIERVIELPYSFDALCALVEGQCDEETLAILKEKMNLYSDYKVVVTRDNSRRYFRCSGCSASSPHGMGDIRKHILGVHAKIPDRFKTACLHGSRLSREDNRLLPDALLIQLAKLKWKGSVGTDAKKNKLSIGKAYNGANNASHYDSIPSMVPMKGDVKSESCKMVDTVAASTSVATVLPSPPEKMEAPPDRPTPPFDLYAIRSRSKLDKHWTFQCSKCSFVSQLVGPVRGHIVRDHMKVAGYRCSLCDNYYGLKSQLITHHNLEHLPAAVQYVQMQAYKYAMSRIETKTGSPDRIKIKLSFKKDASSEAEEMVIEQREDTVDADNTVEEEAKVEEEEDGLMEEDVEEETAVVASNKVEDDNDERGLASQVMVNGQEMLLMPNKLDQPVDPAPIEACYAIRRASKYGNGSYQCSVCPTTVCSKNLGSIKDHIVQYHMGIFPYHCHLCNTTYWSKEVLVNHFNEEHPGTKPNNAPPQQYRDAIKNLPTRSHGKNVRNSKSSKASSAATENSSPAGSECALST